MPIGLTTETIWDTDEGAREIANEVVGAFTRRHPDIRMNYSQWSDLIEMIEREVKGHGDCPGIGAKDLIGGCAALRLEDVSGKS